MILPATSEDKKIMAQEMRRDVGIESIWEVYEALGGERRPYHPLFSINELADEAVDPLEERPENKEESWGRPHLGSYTEDIGEMVENYLEDVYDMERVNNGAVDLRVTDGVFEGIPVQAKGAVILASQGPDGKGTWYSRPGGIYMREGAIEELSEEDSLLHTVVHYPKEEFTDAEREKLSVPFREVHDGSEKTPVESALVGELVMPVNKVAEEVNFNNNGYKYWDWPEAYGSKPSTHNTVDKWYKDSFIDANI